MQFNPWHLFIIYDRKRRGQPPKVVAHIHKESGEIARTEENDDSLEQSIDTETEREREREEKKVKEKTRQEKKRKEKKEKKRERKEKKKIRFRVKSISSINSIKDRPA